MIGADRRATAHHMRRAATPKALDIREGHGNGATGIEAHHLAEYGIGTVGLDGDQPTQFHMTERADNLDGEAAHSAHTTIDGVFRQFVDQALQGLSGHCRSAATGGCALPALQPG